MPRVATIFEHPSTESAIVRNSADRRPSFVTYERLALIDDKTRQQAPLVQVLSLEDQSQERALR